MKIFCMKCQKKTATEDEYEKTIRVNGGKREMVKGLCEDCGTKKNKFIASK